MKISMINPNLIVKLSVDRSVVDMRFQIAASFCNEFLAPPCNILFTDFLLMNVFNLVSLIILFLFRSDATDNSYDSDHQLVPPMNKPPSSTSFAANLTPTYWSASQLLSHHEKRTGNDFDFICLQKV